MRPALKVTSGVAVVKSFDAQACHLGLDVTMFRELGLAWVEG